MKPEVPLSAVAFEAGAAMTDGRFHSLVHDGAIELVHGSMGRVEGGDVVIAGSGDKIKVGCEL